VFKSPSPKEIVILELLATGSEMYGLEMVEASAGGLKRGTVYVTLGRMEEKDLLHSKLEVSDAPGPPRRLYKISDHGLRALRAWQLMQTALTWGVTR